MASWRADAATLGWGSEQLDHLLTTTPELGSEQAGEPGSGVGPGFIDEGLGVSLRATGCSPGIRSLKQWRHCSLPDGR